MRRTILFLSILFVSLFTVSCEKEKEGEGSYSFSASIENLSTEDAATKVRLVDEQWVYWEVGDSISIASDKSSSPTAAILANTGGPNYPDFNGTFISELPWESQYFLGLFPYSANNVASGSDGSSDFGTPKIELVARQPFRSDLTFARKVFPMVAWYGGHWDETPGSAYNLDFHSLAGIVRIQFVNATPACTIKEVRITSTDDKQLKGIFDVKDYKKDNPYLSSTSTAEEDKTVTLYCGDEGRSFANGELVTFYLVLPAFDPSVAANSQFALRMEIENTSGKVCTRTFSARVRRTGITYMRALEVTNWESGVTAVRLSGNGTAERPFRIYSVDDLVYLRDCYNSVERKINGQDISANTHIWLMRSDIVLNSTNWNMGIKNFVGHIEDKSNADVPGITSTSSHPLFESVNAGGTVERIALKAEVNYSGESDFSPFCVTNRGTLKDCVLKPPVANPSGVVSSPFANLAGICVNNYGTIEACRNEGNLSAAARNIGCICLFNENGAVVKSCQLSTPFLVNRASCVGGIVYENKAGATVRDCLYAVSTTGSTSRWGGIVYQNNGTVEHCYVNNSIITTLSLGGIVNKQLGGTINYCDCRAQLHAPNVGGIVDTISGGKIVNCFVNHVSAQIIRTSSTSANRSAGGIAAYMLGGSIENSFVNVPHITAQGSGGVLGGLVGTCTGGSAVNCYSYETTAAAPSFFGSNTTATFTNCYLVEGTQTGITSKTEAQAKANDGLVSDLNGNVPSGGKSWVLSGVPVLEAYTVTP